MSAHKTITEELERITTCPVCAQHDPDGLEACSECYNYQLNHIAKLEAKLKMYRKDYEIAAGECLVDVPEPGTDMARLLVANRIMKTRIQELEKQIEDMANDAMERSERSES